ncbi:hypothetical protein Tco_0404866 [Tanacetum coccineum]
MSLLKEDFSRVRIWVKFHDVMLVAYTSDGLSLITKKIGTLMMLDLYTHSMCLESWGRSIYARILIEIDACGDFSDNLIIVVPNLEGTGYTNETICVEYEWKPPRYSMFVKVKKKKLDGNNGGNKSFKPVLAKLKPQYLPKAKQSIERENQKTTPSVGKKSVSTSGNGTFSLINSFEALNVENSVSEEVETGNKASTSSVQKEGQRCTPLVEKNNMFEKQLLEGECMPVNDDGKPLKNVDYSGVHDSEDEIESVDNEMASCLASKPLEVRYGTNSLLEQWKETYVNDNYDPYDDDDMYEGQEFLTIFNLYAIIWISMYEV